jgi:hypothetical protein
MGNMRPSLAVFYGPPINPEDRCDNSRADISEDGDSGDETAPPGQREKPEK